MKGGNERREVSLFHSSVQQANDQTGVRTDRDITGAAHALTLNLNCVNCPEAETDPEACSSLNVSTWNTGSTAT